MKFDYTKVEERIKSLFVRRQAMYPIESIWLSILFTLTAATILVTLWSFILFIRVSGDDVFAVAPKEGESVETLNRSQLETLLSTLRKRQAAFDSRTQRVIEPVAQKQEDDEDSAEGTQE